MSIRRWVILGWMVAGLQILSAGQTAPSQNPSVQGEPVTFTATVSALGTAPVGSVTFKAGNQVVGVVPVTGGVASLTLSALKAGSTHISAKFQGAGFVNVSRGLVQVVD